MKKLLLTGAIAASFLSTPFSAIADSGADSGADSAMHLNHDGLHASSHAPIGVMGDHLHKKGEWMVSYRYMRMHMEDNRSGTNDLSPEKIATTVPNRFFGNPMQPPTLRVVPLEMTTDMHMIGGMYAPTDTVTLMAMTHYIDREMDHVTFAGGMGTTRLGKFKTSAKGLGDTKISALIGLYDDAKHKLHLNTGLSLPTGSITKRDNVLTPMNATPSLRLPYAMQLGSGTFDAMPGITYNGHHNRLGWGAQYMATLRLGRNSADYSLGNKHQLTTWGSYALTPSVSLSARVTGESEGKIDGRDDKIIAPVQTADPQNFGGKRISTSFGLNTSIQNGALKGHRFSAEVTLPIYQKLNGPQLKRDNAIMIGWQKSF